jgi:hypothetical protein
MADIVVNGGFEADVIGSPYVAFASGSTFTGWTVTGPVGSGVDLVRKPEYSALIPFGNQAVDLSGTPGPGGIMQNLTTTANTNYVLQFTVGSNSGPYANSLNVYWNGSLLANLSAPAQGMFQTYTYNVQSSGTSTGLAFESLVGGNQGPTLDGVSVNAVPEPSAFAALGVAAFAAVRFRRRKA